MQGSVSMRIEHNGKILSSNELVALLKIHPVTVMSRVRLVTPRNVGKSVAFPSVAPGITYIHCMATMAEHPARMRGRYVHSHKGKAKRQHRFVTSWLDTWNRKLKDENRSHELDLANEGIRRQFLKSAPPFIASFSM